MSAPEKEQVFPQIPQTSAEKNPRQSACSAGDSPVAEEHLRSSVPSAAKEEHSPKISVIVPVYKVEKYLPECIESVLAQTFTDFELILVDDGSPDDCGAICDAYAARNPRIRVFHKENGGVSSARNLGLDHARGEWIAFVDSDDTVGEKYLEHLWGEGPAAGTLIFSGFTYLDEKGRETRRLQFAAGTRPVREAFREEQLYRYGHPFSKLYDARVVARERLRFDPEISMAEDMIFMADYLRFASAVAFRDIYAEYMYTVRELSLSNRPRSFESNIHIYIEVQKAFLRLGFQNLNSYEKTALSGFAYFPVDELYRKNSFNRRQRVEMIKELLSYRHFPLEASTLRHRLLLHNFITTFDFLSTVFFFLQKTPVKTFYTKLRYHLRRNP